MVSAAVILFNIRYMFEYYVLLIIIINHHISVGYRTHAMDLSRLTVVETIGYN